MHSFTCGEAELHHHVPKDGLRSVISERVPYHSYFNSLFPHPLIPRVSPSGASHTFAIVNPKFKLFFFPSFPLLANSINL